MVYQVTRMKLAKYNYDSFSLDIIDIVELTFTNIHVFHANAQFCYAIALYSRISSTTARIGSTRVIIIDLKLYLIFLSSAGRGRTGCFIAICQGIDQLEVSITIELRSTDARI